ncbi:MAG: hypothetical protein J6U23_05520 [Clostridiales bacterium]|nr:hypothetical protein [Clostridiales bacterium]
MKNKTYDILKYLVTVGLPALTTLWLALASIWGFPYAEAIGATLTALTAFFATLLGISSYNYHKSIEAEENSEC